MQKISFLVFIFGAIVGLGLPLASVVAAHEECTPVTGKAFAPPMFGQYISGEFSIDTCKTKEGTYILFDKNKEGNSVATGFNPEAFTFFEHNTNTWGIQKDGSFITTWEQMFTLSAEEKMNVAEMAVPTRMHAYAGTILEVWNKTFNLVWGDSESKSTIHFFLEDKEEFVCDKKKAAACANTSSGNIHVIKQFFYEKMNEATYLQKAPLSTIAHEIAHLFVEQYSTHNDELMSVSGTGVNEAWADIFSYLTIEASPAPVTFVKNASRSIFSLNPLAPFSFTSFDPVIGYSAGYLEQSQDAIGDKDKIEATSKFFFELWARLSIVGSTEITASLEPAIVGVSYDTFTHIAVWALKHGYLTYRNSIEIQIEDMIEACFDLSALDTMVSKQDCLEFIKAAKALDIPIDFKKFPAVELNVIEFLEYDLGIGSVSVNAEKDVVNISVYNDGPDPVVKEYVHIGVLFENGETYPVCVIEPTLLVGTTKSCEVSLSSLPKGTVSFHISKIVNNEKYPIEETNSENNSYSYTLFPDLIVSSVIQGSPFLEANDSIVCFFNPTLDVCGDQFPFSVGILNKGTYYFKKSFGVSVAGNMQSMWDTLLAYSKGQTGEKLDTIPGDIFTQINFGTPTSPSSFFPGQTIYTKEQIMSKASIGQPFLLMAVDTWNAENEGDEWNNIFLFPIIQSKDWLAKGIPLHDVPNTQKNPFLVPKPHLEQWIDFVLRHPRATPTALQQLEKMMNDFWQREGNR